MTKYILFAGDDQYPAASHDLIGFYPTLEDATKAADRLLIGKNYELPDWMFVLGVEEKTVVMTARVGTKDGKAAWV
jgi:hypothetical protein